MFEGRERKKEKDRVCINNSFENIVGEPLNETDNRWFFNVFLRVIYKYFLLY